MTRSARCRPDPRCSWFAVVPTSVHDSCSTPTSPPSVVTPEADIFLDDVTVSRRHAEFLRSGTQFDVKDLGSLNGTYLDGNRIAGTIALHDGSEVQIGKFRLTFYASRVDLAHVVGN